MPYSMAMLNLTYKAQQMTKMLTFASIILLWLTWNTSKKELKETREQLHFQSNRDTLKIILDDLVETLSQKIKPSSTQIEQTVENIIEKLNDLPDEEFKKYFSFEKNFLID